MRSERKRRRRLKKKVKNFLLAIPGIVAIVLIIIFCFQIKSVTLSSDLGQYTEQEVLDYLEYEDIDNALVLWIRSLLGIEPELDLYEDYKVSLKSPTKIKIEGYEKELKGYIEEEKTFYYMDEEGKVLKITSQKIQGIPKIVGLNYKKIEKNKVIEPTKAEDLSVLLKVIKCVDEYGYPVKKISVNEESEVTIYIKKIQIQLGKENQMEEKVLALNDMYENVIEYQGVLNMKYLDPTGTYTLKKTEKTKKKK